MMNGIPLEEIEGNFQDGQAETAKAVFRRAITKLRRAIQKWRRNNAYRQ
jgi:hypothetical protein